MEKVTTSTGKVAVTNAKRDKFEKWARKMGMKPICVIDDPLGYILVADSGVLIDVDDEEGKRKVYRTGWALERRGMQFGAWAEYDAGEFPGYSLSGAQQLRVNEAVENARDVVVKWDDAEKDGSLQRAINGYIH